MRLSFQPEDRFLIAVWGIICQTLLVMFFSGIFAWFVTGIASVMS